MSKKMRIAVIGGGMGGTTATLLFQRAGYECKLYEQAPAFAHIGAGINVAPNSTRIFRELGLEEKMLAAGIQPKLKFSRTWDTGEVTYTVPVPELRERYNAPLLAFHRGALQDVLCSELQPGSVEFDKRLVGINEQADSVVMAFADGSTAEADVVIAADGVHSKAREILFGVSPPNYYGLVAYRSLIPSSALGGLELADNTKWWAPHGYVLLYYTTEARNELNVITGTREEWQGEDFAPKQATVEELLACHQGYHPEVQQVLRAATKITKWPMLERQPFNPWSKGRVVLMGDAAHPTTPHMGQGAGMAFEDAVVLFRCLDSAEGGDVGKAFERYEAARYARTSRIQHESHENEWTRTGMDADWLYGYDAFKVPLP
jgi:6-hydroxynicotinate 3-monooxygenase